MPDPSPGHTVLPPPQRSPEDEVDELLRAKADQVRLETGRAPREGLPIEGQAMHGGGTHGQVADYDTTLQTEVVRALAGEAASASAEAADILSAARSAVKTSALYPTDRVRDAKESERFVAHEGPIEDETEEAERLLEELMAEAQLEDSTRATGVPPGASAYRSRSLGGEAEPIFPAAPVQKVLASAPGAQHEKDGAGSAAAQDAEMERWCCICNEDAVCWCNDCDGDPYCRRCFNEGHQDTDLKSHKTVAIIGSRRR